MKFECVNIEHTLFVQKNTVVFEQVKKDSIFSHIK